ncbi:uncharacterized protein [Hyperolius riggenbachi]|uniref:uncharacterized protein n=1 Tax=Hyperolius riggenbachi TaxID=752182 RepID=UPI0035A37CD5
MDAHRPHTDQRSLTSPGRLGRMFLSLSGGYYRRRSSSRSRHSRSRRRTRSRSRSRSPVYRHKEKLCWACAKPVAPGKTVCPACFLELGREPAPEPINVTEAIQKAVQESMSSYIASLPPAQPQSAQVQPVHMFPEEEEVSLGFDFALVDPFIKAVREVLEWEDVQEEDEEKTKKKANKTYYKHLYKTKCTFPVMEEIRAIIQEEWWKMEKKVPMANRFSKMYPLPQVDTKSLDEPPVVDASVTRLAKYVTLPIKDAITFRDTMELKIDMDLRKMYTGSGGACKLAIALTSVGKAVRAWTENAEQMIRDDVDKETLITSMEDLKIAGDFIGEAAIDVLRSSARSMLYSVTAKRALWLRSWSADPASRQLWCKIPFDGRTPTHLCTLESWNQEPSETVEGDSNLQPAETSEWGNISGPSRLQRSPYRYQPYPAMPPKGSKNKEDGSDPADALTNTPAQQKSNSKAKKQREGDSMADLLAEGPSSPSSTEILEAIRQCQTTLTQKIDKIEVNFGLLREDFSKIRTRITDLEQRTSNVEDSVQAHRVAIPGIQQRLTQLENRAVDAENRNRRSNLRILGIPEKSEGSDVVTFIETLLKEKLPEATFSSFFAVERAHRLTTKKEIPGNYPRPIILKLLNFRDRDEILKAARKEGDIYFQSSRLMIFPDYTNETQKQRRSFQQVKEKLRELQLPYSMLFPARLRVQDGDKLHFFETPEEASRWLRSHKKQVNKE